MGDKVMKNSERFAAATAYADNAFANTLGVSPSLVGFAMLGIAIDNGIEGSGNRKTPLWSIGPVDHAKIAPFLAAERAASVEQLAAKYAADPMGEGADAYEHEFHPFELCAGIVENCRDNSLEVPEFIVKLADTLLTK